MEYFQKEEDKIICRLCRHHCKIKVGKTGICGVNGNVAGEYKNLVFGYPAAMHIDPIEKKPLYHFLPGSSTFSLGTVGCNYKCAFCQNWSISQTNKINEQRYVSPGEIVQAAMNHKNRSVSFTYNEPTIFYPYAKEIGIRAKKEGIRSVFVTNGFQSEAMLEDMPEFVSAANVDLKSFNDDYYKRELKGGLEAVKSTIKTLVRKKVWVEVTTLIVPGDNSSDEELRAMATFLSQEVGPEVPWHLSAFHPDYKKRDTERTAVPLLLKAHDIGKKAGLHYVYTGNISRENTTECHSCHAELIVRSHFGIKHNVIEGGHCPHCHAQIHGVWT